MLPHQSSSCTNRAGACVESESECAGKRTWPLPAALISVCPGKAANGLQVAGDSPALCCCLKALPQPKLVTLTQFEAVPQREAKRLAGAKCSSKQPRAGRQDEAAAQITPAINVTGRGKGGVERGQDTGKLNNL